MSDSDVVRGKLIKRHSSVFLVWTTVVVVVIVTAITLSIAVTTPLGQAWLAEQAGITIPASTAAPSTAITPSGQSNDDKSSFDQFMTLFLAVAAGAIAYMASAMGMRRLEVYDDKISTVEAEVQERLAQRADKIDERFDSFRAELSQQRETLDKRFETITEASRELIAQAAERQKREIEDEVRKTTAKGEDQLRQTAADVTEESRALGKELEERFGYLTEAKVADRLLMDLPSIGEVHIKVSQAFALKQNENAREMVRAVLVNRSPSGIRKSSGDNNDWFNLGSELGRQDEFNLGLRVNLAGLEQQGTVFVEGGISLDNAIVIDRIKSGIGNGDLDAALDGEPRGIPNVDLFAHALQYAQKIGLHEVAQTLIEIAPRIPVELRNWRFYQFVCGYHDENDNKTEFFELVEEFRERMPFDERSVGLEMEWYERRQQYEQYKEAGEKWLSGQRYSPGSVVPMRLARHAYELGDYQAVLRYTLKGLEGSATAQPNASIAALLFYRANAYDAMCIRALQADVLDTREVLRSYASALRMYHSKMIKESRVFLGSAAERRETLRLLLENAGIDPPPIGQDGAGKSNGSGNGDGEEADPDDGNDGLDGERVMRLSNKIIHAFIGGDERVKSAGLAAFRDLGEPEQLLGRMAFQSARDDEDLPDEARQAAADILQRLGDA